MCISLKAVICWNALIIMISTCNCCCVMLLRRLFKILEEGILSHSFVVGWSFPYFELIKIFFVMHSWCWQGWYNRRIDPIALKALQVGRLIILAHHSIQCHESFARNGES